MVELLEKNKRSKEIKESEGQSLSGQVVRVYMFLGHICVHLSALVS